MTTQFQFVLTDSLEKVLQKREPKALPKGTVISGLQDELISFQLAYRCESDEYDTPNFRFNLKINATLMDHITVRKVEYVPCAFPSYGVWDEHYLTTEPGLLPDLLVPLTSLDAIKAIPAQWRALWIDVKLDNTLVNKNYDIQLTAEKLDGTLLWTDCVSIQVVQHTLPMQTLLHTEWFHADCLASYYNVDVFSEAHWTIIDRFMHSASEHGVNMLLTPIFTPPLDTAIGGERTTTQLVEVYRIGDTYTFNFDLLHRWIKLCHKHHITQIEFSHLFTQWGAKHAPKIIATVEGQKQQIFGWDTDAVGDEYIAFLSAFLPQLKQKLKEWNIFEQCWFHISDEPHEHQKATYAAAKTKVASLLSDCKVIDALSSFTLYQEGIIEKPVVCLDHLEPFIEAKVEGLWAYHCTVQALHVSNRFIAMPSYRNRILGVLFYLYEIEGFLHWGFNFYNAQWSTHAINPYLVTDAGEAFPSGDPFLVYPAPDGHAYESIRGMVLKEALFDLRALQLLESYIGREKVVALIYEQTESDITFSHYPHSSEYIHNLRKRVNECLMTIDN